MAVKRPRWHPGSLVNLEHRSKVLRGNPLGDPHRRRLAVWLPPDYETGSQRYPVLYDLAGFTSSGLAHTNWRNFEENVPERAARLLHEGRIGPCLLVFPDCFTALGGNQYINSTAIGRYADYLVRELVPFVDAEFRTLAAPEHRGCFGKSSGGYGALVHGMKYARHWGAIAAHAGDAYFDFVYRRDWPDALNVLARHRRRRRRPGPVDVSAEARATGDGRDDGRVRRFLKYMAGQPNPRGEDIGCLMMLAMAASYDPDPAAPNGFRVPFDLETGEEIPGRWKHWRRHDPVRMVARYRANLATLRGIYIDCGWRDQYQIHFGARALSRRLQEHGIAHRYEEFDGTHSGIDHRLDVSLPFLYAALT